MGCCQPKYALLDEDIDGVGLLNETSVDVRSLENTQIAPGQYKWVNVSSAIPTAVLNNEHLYNTIFISRDISDVTMTRNRDYITDQSVNVGNFHRERDVQIDINDLLGRVYFKRKDSPIRFN